MKVMALIDTNLQITDIGNHIYIIRDVGTDSEEVLLKYNPANREAAGTAFDKVQDSVDFTRNQKYWIFFWMGYFYAHLGRRK